MNINHLALIRLVFALTTGVFVVVPVIIPYYQSKGLSTADFFLIFAFYHFFSIFFELPTGYFSDLWHRKKILSISSALLVFANIIILFSDHVFGIMIGQFFFAAGLALHSGTIQAYLYDYLAYYKQESQAHYQIGAKYTVQNIVETICFVLGGLLFSLHVDLPQIATILLLFIGFILTLFLPDIPRKRRETQSHLRDFGLLLRNEAWLKSGLRYGILFSALISSALGILYWLAQPAMSNAGIPVTYFGGIMAVYLVIQSIASYKSHLIFKRIRPVIIFSLLIFITPLIFLAFATTNTAFIIIALVAMAIAGGVVSPYFITFLSENSASENRATILSLAALVTHIIAGALSLGTSLYLDQYGLLILSPVLGCLVLVALIISWARFQRHLQQNDSH